MKNLGACFIEPERDIDTKAHQPASYLRRTFGVGKEVSRAELEITACGLYKGYLNGHAITDQVFMPGFTYYTKRLQVQVHDVTPLIVQGPNVLAAVLGDGWYRGKIGVSSKRFFYGEKTKLAAVLEITFADGSQETITTDETWKATQDGPIRKSDWKDGEIYDARQELSGWNEPGYDDSNWHAVYPASYEGALVASEGEQILEHERFTPQVITTPDGSTVLDFGQNIFGYVAFSVSGKSGHTVKLTHGETLDENGNFTLKNLRPEGLLFQGRGLCQEVEYTLKDGEQHYQPSFTAQGFRYVKLEGWPGTVVPDDFAAIAVYSDMDEVGQFQCSDPDINRLVENTKWSQKGNFMDIPTDCPTRERAGWSGDIAAFCETGSYLMDTNRFLAKWMKDLALQQRDDGCVASIIPSVGLPAFVDGSAGWADAAVIIPYILYKVYGNRDILVDQYDSMVKWLSFLENRAAKTRLVNRLRRNPYKEYVIDTGYHWGEWLEPGHVMGQDALRNLFLPDAEVATAYYAYSSGLLAQIAQVLGKSGDAARYRSLSENVKTAYRYTFTSDGLVESDRQCRYVRPVALDLLPEADKKKNVERLNQMVVDNDYKIGTGFLTTPFILSVLTDYGYVDTAYKMAENRHRPGWLYEVEKGATTIWENWNGIDDEGVPRDSFNHYAFGAVTGWYFSRVAGITPLEPGYRKTQIKPVPGGTLTSADCSYKSAAGLIKSAWQRKGNNFSLRIQVPGETTVCMPDGTVHHVSTGEHTFSCRLDYKVLRKGGHNGTQ
jgi:alpha-L-rhamnosidase